MEEFNLSQNAIEEVGREKSGEEEEEEVGGGGGEGNKGVEVDLELRQGGLYGLASIKERTSSVFPSPASSHSIPLP